MESEKREQREAKGGEETETESHQLCSCLEKRNPGRRAGT